MYGTIRYIPSTRVLNRPVRLESGAPSPAAEGEAMPPREVAERSATGRERDPERTRNEILEIATREFAALGYAGASVDELAKRMRTTKRMIYYYFGSKEGLFIAVLE